VPALPCDAPPPFEVAESPPRTIVSSMASARTADIFTRYSACVIRSSERESITAAVAYDNSEETMLEQRILKGRRAVEEDERALELLRLKRGSLEAWKVTTSTICTSVVNAERPAKRTRSDAMGRTEALVLNGPEQLVAAEARLKLRQNQKEMKLEIRQAKKAARVAVVVLTSLCKDLQKACTDVVKQQQNCDALAAKTLDSASKKTASTSSAQAQKAAEKALYISEGMATKLPLISEAMITALQRKASLFQAEQELKKLEEAARNVQDHDDDDAEEEEEDDGDTALINAHATDEVACKYEEARAHMGEARMASKKAQEHTNKVALYALLAAAKEA